MDRYRLDAKSSYQCPSLCARIRAQSRLVRICKRYTNYDKCLRTCNSTIAVIAEWALLRLMLVEIPGTYDRYFLGILSGGTHI